MYAIIQSGGKQYPVQVGQSLRLEKIPAEVGQSIDLEQVLLVKDEGGCHIGTPLLADARVQAEVQSHGRAKKINLIKFKRRKHHMKRMGHRQHFTQVKITAINLAGAADNSTQAQSAATPVQTNNED